MGHPGIVTRFLQLACAPRPPRTIVELGAGDGKFMLRAARRLAPHWPKAKVVLLDRLDVVRAETLAALAALGWEAETVVSDVFDWLASPDPPRADCVVTNLFLHHFDQTRVSRLLEGTAKLTDVFVACEPRRSGAVLAASRLLWWLGCNAVTRHDAAISVRAGFTGQELLTLWPRDDCWRLAEGSAGLFSHYLIAQRVGRAF